jgi:hypothetical protein
MTSHDRKSKVARYSGSTVTQEIKYSDTGEPLYSDPISVTENKNLDIVVSNFGKKSVSSSGEQRRQVQVQL